MKPDIVLELGKETSGSELEEICRAFETDFNVTHRTEIIRLSDDVIPLLILFTVSSVASGLYWDAIKAALGKLFVAYKSGKLPRKPSVVLRHKTHQYVITKDRIFEKSREEEVEFYSLDAFIEYMKDQENFE